MTNSDTTYGLFNKQTKEIKHVYEALALNYSGGDLVGPADGDVVPQSFAGNVETAKSTFFTADALACNDTNGTQLEYAITADGNGIKFTIAFGSKDSPIAQADNWSRSWATTKDALIAADNWVKKPADQRWLAEDATPHLF